MKDANEFFRSFTNGLVGGLNTIAIGQIERFDPIKMKADVVILPDGTLIVDVPVATIQTSEYFIRVPYESGDHVVVAFAQRDIDGIMFGGDVTPSKRMMSLDDAVVIGGISLYSDPLPIEDSDKLVIGQKNGSAKIVMSDGKISLIGQVDINGNTIG